MLHFKGGEEIIEINENQEWYCIFLYKQGEDTNMIKGQCPLVYSNEQDLFTYVFSDSGRSDIKEWVEDGLTVVIRTVKMTVS